MAEAKDGCVTPALGPIDAETGKTETAPTETPRKEAKMTAKIGKPAPDFEASAFVDGGFRNIKMSDYKGQWVILCFYPGDFTFV